MRRLFANALGCLLLLPIMMTLLSPIAFATPRTPNDLGLYPIQDSLSEFAEIAITKDYALRNIQTSESPDKVIDQVISRITQLRKIADSTSSPRIAWLAALSIAQVMKFYEIENYDSESGTLLEKYFNGCESFSHCTIYLRTLSEFEKYNPLGALKKLESLEWKSSDSFQQTLIDFHITSIKASLLLHAHTQLHMISNRGKVPSASPEKIRDVESVIDQANLKFKRLMSFKNDHSKLSSVFSEILSGYNTLMLRDLNSFEVLNEISNSMFENFELTNLGTKTLRLYLQRLNKRNASGFINSARALVLQSHKNNSVVFYMAARFADVESYLPYRHEWQKLIENTQLSLNSQETKIIADATETLMKVRQDLINSMASVQGFAAHNPSQELLSTLIGSEKELTQRYPIFHSLYYQLQKLQKEQNALAVSAALWTSEKSKRIKDAYQHQIGQNKYSALEQWLTIACYGKFVNPNAVNNSKFSVAFVPEVKNIDLNEACPTHSPRGPETQTIEYSKYKHVKAIWAPVLFEAYVSLALIPVTVFSVGVGSVAQKAVISAVARKAAEMALRASLGKISTFFIARAIPNIAGAMSGTLVGNAVTRTTLSLSTLGKVPVFDTSLSISQNYGRDLVIGMGNFFVRPYLLKNIAGLGEKTVRYFNPSSTHARMLVRATPDWTITTSYYAALPFLVKGVQSATGFTPSKTNFVGDWDYKEAWLRSLAFSLVFSLSRGLAP